MSLQFVPKVDPDASAVMEEELEKFRSNLMLVASGNHLSPAVLETQGTVFANERAEGYPGSRYFAGAQYVDKIEELAIERAKDIFGAEHANVQPHSGTQANMAVYVAMLDPGDSILSLELSHGGHLSHGHPVNFSGQYYDIYHYHVDSDTGLLDYDELETKAHEIRPDMIVTGFSAYPREIDFKRVQSVANDIGAHHMADCAHITGLIAAGKHPSPVGLADFVTGSTHKTLRSGRGGFIMCNNSHADEIDSGVFPGSQGDPLMHNIAAKAVGFHEALNPEFEDYITQVITNAKTLSNSLIEHGLTLVSEGTDNHLMLVDLRETHPDMTGKEAESLLEEVGIIVNANPVPGDHRPPRVTSGIRIGTPSVTTRGLDSKTMETVGKNISRVLNNPDEEAIKNEVRNLVREICSEHQLYEELEY